MESSFKEPVDECLQGSCKVNMDFEQASSHDTSTPELTQLELIEQWRFNLQFSLKNLGLSFSDKSLTDGLKDLSVDINEKLGYLKITDDLLFEHDDFTLSDAGFEKYKSTNLAFFVI